VDPSGARWRSEPGLRLSKRPVSAWTVRPACKLRPLSEPASSPRRRYDSPLRRQRVAETRQRIINAGSDLIHDLPIWNWRELTIRAVAKRADLHERTVYRYFPTERELHDAVLARLREEAGVNLEGLRLADIADTTRKIFEYTSTFPQAPRILRDPSIAAENQRQREALVAAVEPVTKTWPPRERAKAAAIFDVLWDVVSYERLVSEWRFSPQDAISAITWAVGLVEDAVRQNRRPQGRTRSQVRPRSP
jgi:AcrR family transcriptional regulator